MSQNAHDIEGKVILIAQLEATPEGADKVEAVIKKIREFCLSDAEPDCLVFRVNKFGTKFAIFEEYRNAAATDFHFKQKDFLDLLKLVQEGYLVQPPQLAYYKEVD